jgi:hypothetical protein
VRTTTSITPSSRSARPGDQEAAEYGIVTGGTATRLASLSFAIDGTAAKKSVTAYEDRGDYVSLSDALHTEQMRLVRWLGERGYEIEFE